jgi:hypothetical protein
MMIFHVATWIALIICLVSIFIVNLVFGYWRANTRKFTAQWIAAIHTPVPLAIGLRLLLLGWNWLLVPIFVFDFAAGQYLGGWIRKRLSIEGQLHLTSWLLGDFWRLLKTKIN